PEPHAYGPDSNEYAEIGSAGYNSSHITTHKNHGTHGTLLTSEYNSTPKQHVNISGGENQERIGEVVTKKETIVTEKDSMNVGSAQRIKKKQDINIIKNIGSDEKTIVEEHRVLPVKGGSGSMETNVVKEFSTGKMVTPSKETRETKIIKEGNVTTKITTVTDENGVTTVTTETETEGPTELTTINYEGPERVYAGGAGGAGGYGTYTTTDTSTDTTTDGNTVTYTTTTTETTTTSEGSKTPSKRK
ncbi:15207_t:CDS:2, partial [Acaulospora morrowiae]